MARVRIECTVDVDLDDWATEYGLEDRREARADVKEYAQRIVQAHIDHLGLNPL